MDDVSVMNRETCAQKLRVLTKLLNTAFSLQIGPKQWCGKTFEKAFTGSNLIDKLLCQNHKDFDCREKARLFAQESLKQRHFYSIVRSPTFEDGEQWYYWSADDTLKNSDIEQQNKVKRVDVSVHLLDSRLTIDKQLLKKCQHSKTSI